LVLAPTDENKEAELHTKPTALVVDDSTDIAFMLITILQQAGYEALMVTSAKEALNLISRKRFDLVISDIAMPEMDGYALAKEIRSLPEYQAVHLIAVTGFDQYDDRELAIEAGFDTHLKKPIDPTTFMKVIRSLTS
jgi:CheY-like chemotaxis protein